MAEEIYVIIEETIVLDDNLRILESWTNIVSAHKDADDALKELWEVANSKYFLALRTADDPNALEVDCKVGVKEHYSNWYYRLQFQETARHPEQKFENLYYRIQKCACF